jgi:AraC-like DNA-binding protein
MSKKRQAQIRTFSARFSPGHLIEMHSHSWSQLVYAGDGVIAVESDNACWIVPTSRAIWVPAGQKHSIKMYGKVFLQTVYFESSSETKINLPCAAYEITSLLRELMTFVCRKGIVNSDTDEHCNLIDFLTFQVRELKPFPLMVPMPRDRRAKQLASRLINHPGTGRSLADLCEECGASLRTMQRVFSKELGLPLSRWRNQVMMVHAIQLLASDRTITQVSLELGFESVSAFIFSFRKYFGVSPGQYRLRHEATSD